MNKNAIKTYAIWARNELIDRVSQKAYEYGIEKDNIVSSDAQSVNGRLLSDSERRKRQSLISEVNHKGYEQVIEEVAYTWFNRFIALRYMEVNNYLPNKVRLFTNENNEFKPQIIEEALHIELEGLDKNKVFELKEANNNEELYKELLLATCNDMHKYLPGMFKSIDDYMTLLFPNNLLREESVLGRLISDIDEDSWTDQVQIIGWLYQYYISEKHEEVIDPLHGKTITKEEIPAATQLFTTDWVVRYMVDNSLGRYWIERNKDSQIKKNLSFYVSSKKGNDKYVNERIVPESITFLDPCMGSGHILVYAFDVFMQIYVSEGWTEREAAVSILKNNLFGLDIDERAYQLSYFALMMKARQYNRRILSENITPNVMAIEESNTLRRDLLDRFGDLKPLATRLIDTFTDAKEYGSILNVEFTKKGLDSLDLKLKELDTLSSYEDLLTQADIAELIEQFTPLLKQARIMSAKYGCVVTNPPYLNKMDKSLRSFVLKNYKEYSADLFSVFIRKNFDFCNENGYLGFMTPNVWMFIKSYEALRELIISKKGVSSLIQLAKGAFFSEATVDICTFVLANCSDKIVGNYIRLEDFKGGMDVQEKKVLDAINNDNCTYFYEVPSSNFKSIEGKPIAYWVSEKVTKAFSQSKIEDYCLSKCGMGTSNNAKFLRLWQEIELNKIGFNYGSIEETKDCRFKWFPYNKGGDYRKWYGNNSYVVNFYNNGADIREATKNATGGRIVGSDYYFKKQISWSDITSGSLSFRKYKDGFIFDASANCAFIDDKMYDFLLAYVNTKQFNEWAKIINPTIHFKIGNFQKMPFVIENKERVDSISQHNVSLSKSDWDSFETSWDFRRHPLVVDPKWREDQLTYNFNAKVRHDEVSLISVRYERWKDECEDRFNHLKSNEEELNRIFIDIYGLQDELTPEVEDKDVTVRKADLTREIKSLISYAVGCMFGRYSLDIEGLAYAGGEWDGSKYKTYIPDSDNILPITDDEYFEDDVVSRFINFIKAAYGEDTLEENLKFISDALGGKGSPREVIRSYFLNDFFKDHCNTYQVTGSGKRPIYWQFDSGKKNGFKALMYIHRYTPDLIARMRTSYIHELQSKYNSQISLLEGQIDSAVSTSDRVKLEKQLKKIKEQSDELRAYEEKIHHYADMMMPMDLDDGVKVNYAKFEELLAKIK